MLFDGHTIQDLSVPVNRHRVLSISEESTVRQIAEEIFDEIIALPLIEVLARLVKFGSDPKAVVQKLKQFRPEEKKK